MPQDTHRAVGHVVARHPLLPLEVLEAFTDAAKKSPEAGRAFLRELISRPDVNEALYVASPGLMEGMEKWRKEPLSERGQKIERALISYIERMASRCTPFGLFASVSVGHVGKSTITTVASLGETRRRTRLDNGYLQAVCEQLNALPEVRRNLKYTTNETLHQVGERLHFVTARQEGTRRVYDLSAVDALEALTTQLLPYAREGRTPKELSELLQRTMVDISQEEADGFIDQLIDAQILLGSLSVPLTGREGLDAVLDQLETLPREAVATHIKALQAAREALAGLDKRIGNSSADYDQLGKILEPLGLPLEKGKLVQVDLARLGDTTEFSESLLRQLVRIATLASCATPGGGEGALSAFKTAFGARYEGAEVPLLEALDDEAGVGFTAESSGHAAPLLKDVLFTPGGNSKEEFDAEWSAWVGGLLMKAIATGSGEIVLTEPELEHRARRAYPFAESCALMVTLYAKKPNSPNAPIAIINGVNGPSSELLFGRFAYLDERLEQAVREGIKAEEALRPEAKFAELLHSPEGRAGNVIARPAVRDLEIPILSRGGRPASHSIRLDDLMLSMSDGRLVLRSKSLDCEIVPRLTNAHNYTYHGMPTYRFLAAMQAEGLTQGGLWSWGPHRHAPILPRVRVGNVVLQSARWVINKEVLKTLKDVAALRGLADRLRMPRYLVAKEGDNTLAVDLANDLSLETFLDSYGNRPTATLEEDLDRLFGSPFTNDKGSFTNELVVPLVAKARYVPALKKSPATSVKRVFTSGSDWLYARVHVTPAMAERVLTAVAPDLISWARSTGELKQWFFIKYDEQGHHLRFRFSGNPAWLREQLLPKFEQALQPWVETKIVSRVVVDTYRREVERYGGDEGVGLAERWFEVASDEALALITALPRDTDLEARSWAAFIGVERLQRLLHTTDDAKIKTLEGWRNSIFTENGGGSTLEGSLSKVSRTHRAHVAALIEGKWPESLNPVADVLNAQTTLLSPLAESYKQLEAANKLTVPLGSVAGALMHMHVNRLMRANQRRQEMVMYDLLLRHLKSQQGRTRGREG